MDLRIEPLGLVAAELHLEEVGARHEAPVLMHHVSRMHQPRGAQGLAPPVVEPRVVLVREDCEARRRRGDSGASSLFATLPWARLSLCLSSCMG